MTGQREAAAMEPIPYGAPVREIPGGFGVAHDPRDMVGVARRCGAHEHHYAPGDTVKAKTEGGILMLPPADADLDVIVGGTTRRLQARTPIFVELERGRIVG